MQTKFCYFLAFLLLLNATLEVIYMYNTPQIEENQTGNLNTESNNLIHEDKEKNPPYLCNTTQPIVECPPCETRNGSHKPYKPHFAANNVLLRIINYRKC
jgi:hypothetical protein